MVDDQRDYVTPIPDKDKLILAKDLQLHKNDQVLDRSLNKQIGDQAPVTLDELI